MIKINLYTNIYRRNIHKIYTFGKSYSQNKLINYSNFVDKYSVFKKYNNYSLKNYSRNYKTINEKTFFSKHFFSKNIYEGSSYLKLNQNSYTKNRNLKFYENVYKINKYLERYKKNYDKNLYLQYLKNKSDLYKNYTSYENKLFQTQKNFNKQYKISNFSEKQLLKQYKNFNLSLYRQKLFLHKLTKGFKLYKALLSTKKFPSKNLCSNFKLSQQSFLHNKTYLSLNQTADKILKHRYFLQSLKNYSLSKLSKFNENSIYYNKYKSLDFDNKYKKFNNKYKIFNLDNKYKSKSNLSFNKTYLFKTEELLSKIINQIYTPKNLKLFKKIYKSNIQNSSQTNNFENFNNLSYKQQQNNQHFYSNNQTKQIDYEEIFCKLKSFIYEEITNFCDGIY